MLLKIKIRGLYATSDKYRTTKKKQTFCGHAYVWRNVSGDVHEGLSGLAGNVYPVRNGK